MLNRRGFLSACAAAIVAPSIPLGAPQKVAGLKALNWVHVQDLWVNPNVPLTSSIIECYEGKDELSITFGEKLK